VVAGLGSSELGLDLRPLAPLFFSTSFPIWAAWRLEVLGREKDRKETAE
jgi:hypothetical protein